MINFYPMEIKTIKTFLKRRWFFLKYRLLSDVIFQVRMSYLEKNLTPGRGCLIDVGCGNGYTTSLSAFKGYQSLGISHSQADLDFAQWFAATLKLKNASFLKGDIRYLDQLPKDQEKFEVVLCLEVIEHLINDQKLLKDIGNLMSAGARLILTTPNRNYKPLYGDTVSNKEDGNHVRWGYTFEELETLCQKAHLKIIEKEYFGGFVAQMLTNLCRILEKKLGAKSSWRLTLLLRVFLVADDFITRVIKYPYLSLTIIARKES